MTHKTYESLLTRVLKKSDPFGDAAKYQFRLTNQFNYVSKYSDGFGGQSSVFPLAQHVIRTREKILLFFIESVVVIGECLPLQR